MKINFNDSITITQLFQNGDIKENHIKKLNKIEKKVCKAAFSILNERTIDNAPKKEHKPLKQKIIQNITDILTGPEPEKGNKRFWHKINSFWKGICNFFGRISSLKIQTAMTAYNADLSNANVEINDLDKNIQQKKSELKTNKEEIEKKYGEIYKLKLQFLKESWMRMCFGERDLSMDFVNKMLKKIDPDTYKYQKERVVEEQRDYYKKQYNDCVVATSKKWDENSTQLMNLKKEKPSLENDLDRLNKTVQLLKQKYTYRNLG